MPKITPVLLDLRSIHNVGSILRTAEGFGIEEVLSIGTTPHTRQKNDVRLPHVIERVHSQLQKTALGAEQLVKMRHFSNWTACLEYLSELKCPVYALESGFDGHSIEDTEIKEKQMALIVGSERDGIPPAILNQAEDILEIPMAGKKSSLNVSIALAVAVYALNK